MTLQAIGLTQVKGQRTLFEDVSFELDEGQVLRVAGRNGSGKTTLLRLLCGFGRPLRGEVRFKGLPVLQDREAFHRSLIYIGHQQGLKDELSALENLRINAWLSGLACTAAQAHEALDALGLKTPAHLPVRALSQGQRRRVLLATLALKRPTQASVLILDEPFVALDHDSVQAIVSLLERRLKEGAMLIYATHQPQALQAGCIQELHLSELEEEGAGFEKAA